MKCPKCGAELELQGELVLAEGEKRRGLRGLLRLALVALAALAAIAACATLWRTL